ncbi:MAG: serine/threonine protein kinase [Candidatus Omnitrophota bacterium]|jgi:serine/threonine protein kinase
MSSNAGIKTESVDVVACHSCGLELDVSEFELFTRIECPQCQTELAVPGRLSHFVLLDELGQGAMGTVYLAVDENLDRQVALKVMREEYGVNEDALAALQSEAVAAAALNHKNVVQVYEFGQSINQPFIVMELVNGGRLDLEMAAGKPLNEQFVLKVAGEVSEGLAAAQAAGLTHGDIKPANIMFDKKGNAKVVDFGLARFGGGKPGEVWGTPFYIAPEKAKGKSEDWRSDQYSLGATLWHALSGYPPFDGATPTDVVVARLKNPVPSLQETNPLITKETAEIIERMMAPSPARRYPTYASVHADLDSALHASSRASEERQANEARTTTSKKKMNPAIPILITTLVVLTTLACIFVYQKKQTSKNLPKPPRVIGGGTPGQTLVARRSVKAPYLRGEKRNLKKAMDLYAEGSSFGAQSTLVKLRDTMVDGVEDSGQSSAWTSIMMGFILVMEKSGSATEEFDRVLKKKIEYKDGVEPVESPKLIAQFMKGDINEEAFTAQSAGAEIWFVGMRDFAIGLAKLTDNKPKLAAPHLKKFIATELDNETDWVGYLRPIAKAKLEEAGQ